jgi:hypothetical protein
MPLNGRIATTIAVQRTLIHALIFIFFLALLLHT